MTVKGAIVTEDTPGGPSSDGWGPSFVRVTGVRRQHFVEFDFALADHGLDRGDLGFDDDLAVEMVLPYAEFRQFCAKHQAVMVPGPEEAALAYLALQTANQDRDRTTPNERGETTR